MSEPIAHFECGPVQIGLLPRPAGQPAEAAARLWLAARLGTRATALPLDRDPHGRPRLALDGLDCNWSHSGPWLTVALGRGVAVGVDVEVARPRPRALELARRFLHPDEADSLAALPEADRTAAFLRLWCAKEAVLKAHGRGLAFGLDRLRLEGFDAGPVRLVQADARLGAVVDWQLSELAVPGAFASVAWRRGTPT